MGNLGLPGFLKRFFWGLAGFEIGRGAKIHRSAVIGCRNARIGRHTEIGEGFRAYGLEELRVGDFVTISPGAIFNGKAAVEIGDNCFLGHGTVVNGYADVRIGKNTALAGAYVQVWTHSTWMEELDGHDVKNRIAGVEIGSGCYIGAGAIVLPGVVIGNGTVVGAGGIVSKNLPKDSLALGVPARLVRKVKRKKPDRENIKKIITEFLHEQGFNSFSFFPDTSGKVVFTWGEEAGGSVFDLKNRSCSIRNREGIRARKLLNWYIARF